MFPFKIENIPQSRGGRMWDSYWLTDAAGAMRPANECEVAMWHRCHELQDQCAQQAEAVKTLTAENERLKATVQTRQQQHQPQQQPKGENRGAKQSERASG